MACRSHGISDSPSVGCLPRGPVIRPGFWHSTTERKRVQTKTHEKRVKLLGRFEQENQRLGEELIVSPGAGSCLRGAPAAGGRSEQPSQHPRPHGTSAHTLGRAGSFVLLSGEEEGIWLGLGRKKRGKWPLLPHLALQFGSL